MQNLLSDRKSTPCALELPQERFDVLRDLPVARRATVRRHSENQIRTRPFAQLQWNHSRPSILEVMMRRAICRSGFDESTVLDAT
jgi:hypothetical protein